MKNDSNFKNNRNSLRDKLTGLGERSIRKSDFPQLQKRLAELERLKALLDESNDAIFLMEIPSGRFIDVNEPACRQMDYTRQELLSMSIYDIIEFSTTERIKQFFLETQVNPGIRETITTALRRRNGDQIPEEIAFSAAFFDDIVYAVAVARDISERKQIEEALRNSERRMADIISFLPDPTWVIDVEGKVVAWNHAIEDMTKVKAEDIVGKGDHEYTIPFYGIRRPVLIDLVLKRDKKWEKEYPYLGEKGNRLLSAETFHPQLGEEGLYIAASAAPLYDSEGRVVGAIETLRDITKRKLAEEALQKAYGELEIKVEERTADLRMANEELRKAEKAAEAATRAKSEFLANMSHDIRTPMNGVITAVDLALSEELPPQLEHYLKIIHSSAYSLLGLINDILDFSKIEAGKLDLEKAPFRLDELLNRVTDMFTTKASKKGIELLVDIERTTPKALIGDPLRLQQIFANLLSNAVKFTEKEGEILVEGKPSETSLDQVKLTFLVKDTGAGIAPEYLPKLFEPFTQAEVSTTRRYSGTGLGLSICKKLVKMMDGEIRVVASELGKGSTFAFTVCLARQAADQEPMLVTPPDIRGLSVLVVDDCADSRLIMQKMLESFSFKVETVFSGNEALSRLKEKQTQAEAFDLVMMDWLMPEQDGIESSRRIREDLKLPLPIILMTAFGKETEVLEAEKAGINGFLTKPVFQSTLFNTIMDVFGKEAVGIVREKKAIITEAAVYKRRLRGIRILVAEDNPTNQEVALAILEGAGIVAEIAENGKEAVEAVRKRRFDAVLMDIQMPEMDGYEATRTIRKDERFASLPIIAITAHAMKGDEEKCLEAGMNAHVSKPIDQNRLFHTLWQLAKDRLRPPLMEKAEAEIAAVAKEEGLKKIPAELPDSLPGIEIQETLKALNIERTVYKRILTGFFRNNQDAMKQLRDAFEKKDQEKLLQLAHSLRGSAGNIGAKELSAASLELETAIRTGREIPSLAILLDKVESALMVVLKSLQTLAEPSEAEIAGIRKKRVASEQVIPLLKQLSDALDRANPEAVKKHLDVVKEYLDHFIIVYLENQINDYDYTEALKTLKGIMENIAGQRD